MKTLGFVVVFVRTLISHAEICNAAAFGGGGSFGAHTAGAFQAFAELLDVSVVNYTAVGGISVGSLNSIGIAQFPPGLEKNGLEGWQPGYFSTQVFTTLSQNITFSKNGS